MAYTNPRGQAIGSDIGPTVSALVACTLADYTAAGTAQPAVGDVVRFTGTANWYVGIAADDTTRAFARVTKVEVPPAGTAVGYLVVEGIDIIGYRVVNVSDLSTITLGDSCIKAGDTTHVEDWDAAGTTGNLIAVAKSGTTGAGTVMCALVA